MSNVLWQQAGVKIDSRIMKSPVATEDNLLKGAGTQALRNLNLAFGLPETLGIPL
jgi:N-acetyl-gamma-glutamylphosphate reductase